MASVRRVCSRDQFSRAFVLPAELARHSASVVESVTTSESFALRSASTHRCIPSPGQEKYRTRSIRGHRKRSRACIGCYISRAIGPSLIPYHRVARLNRLHASMRICSAGQRSSSGFSLAVARRRALTIRSSGPSRGSGGVLSYVGGRSAA